MDLVACILNTLTKELSLVFKINVYESSWGDTVRNYCAHFSRKLVENILMNNGIELSCFDLCLSEENEQSNADKFSKTNSMTLRLGEIILISPVTFKHTTGRAKFQTQTESGQIQSDCCMQHI